MERNYNKVSGVLNNKSEQRNYDLRRYYPEPDLKDLVEQFWFVSWSLGTGNSHNQQNLPDPNFHLVFEKGSTKLIGPVSKVYNYTMEKTGQILGVKFKLGALLPLLNKPLSDYVDKEVDAKLCFKIELDALLAVIAQDPSDETLLEHFQHYLTPLSNPSSRTQIQVQQQVELIKNDASITKVEHLAERTNTSVRTLQRNFLKYVGLNPKWLIRKYRLHRALDELEQNLVSIVDLVERLDYVDQSHLIKDFKEIVGITPAQYLTKVV